MAAQRVARAPGPAWSEGAWAFMGRHLPRGSMLPSAAFEARHLVVLVLIWGHIPGLWAFGVLRGFPPLHVTQEVALLAVAGMLAGFPRLGRRFRASVASVGLLTCSALLTHFSGGYIEAHFHFFVMIIVISLYQEWVPFLLAIGYVVAHHGIVGALDPGSVYNHPDALANPWKWASIHAVFVLAASMASLVNWRLNERHHAQALAAERAEREARERLVEGLRETDRFKTDLLNVAAHELCTPLTPIKVQLHLLLEGREDLSPEQRRSIRVLERNFDRLAALVQDVLEVARLQAGRLALERRPVDLRDLAVEAEEAFRAQAALGDVELLRRAEEGVVVHGDPARLTQVVFNLVSNALKFTPPGGQVAIETALEGGRGVLRVRDTGVGLHADDPSKLFQPFVQLHPELQVGGTGLGLYISRGIVEAHGGSIAAESLGPGRGATFTVAMPLAAPEAPVPAARGPAAAHPAQAPTPAAGLAPGPAGR